MRKCTGLRNRGRSGRSAYSAKGKSKSADRYGQWNNGRQTSADSIGGASRMWPVTAAEVKA